MKIPKIILVIFSLSFLNCYCLDNKNEKKNIQTHSNNSINSLKLIEGKWVCKEHIIEADNYISGLSQEEINSAIGKIILISKKSIVSSHFLNDNRFNKYDTCRSPKYLFSKFLMEDGDDTLMVEHFKLKEADEIISVKVQQLDPTSKLYTSDIFYLINKQYIIKYIEAVCFKFEREATTGGE